MNVARKLIDDVAPGYLWLRYILQQDHKLAIDSENNVAIVKYSQEEDTLCQVLAVMAGVPLVFLLFLLF